MIRTPYLAVDGIVECYGLQNELLGIVLIERRNPPYGLALPGGFVDVGERVEAALVREMREEISLEVQITALLGIYSDPSRDARFHTASAVYICRAFGTPLAADDAKDAFLYLPEHLPLERLCFDHGAILSDYLARIAQDTRRS
ncbi:MAG: NUDIX hydrolase [Campylobacterales bacterium]|nr:NUDIX hydrolase [Campylobacterales bacterium]